tara:strand:- start:695 stop:1195 length:501 start_codon:yes stop_codon:yes gene_type:complete
MDVTAILNEAGEQVFSTATLLKASVGPSNTFSQHPVEDGTVVVDNKIINQVRISIPTILDPNDYKDVYKAIKDASENGVMFSIQTRVATFGRMYIESYPSEESASIYDTISININFVEQIIGTVISKKLASSNVSDKSDVDTENRGEQLPKVDKKTSLQRISGFFE